MSWNEALKVRALTLRREGWEIPDIQRELDVPHRTVSRWCKGILLDRLFAKDTECSIEDCDRKVRCKQLCALHYQQAIREAPYTEEDRERARQRILRDSIVDENGCRIWQGAAQTTHAGLTYGRYQALGETLAHRVSYRAFVGPIPEGLDVDHLCSVPLCVEFTCLEPVTHQENSQRSWDRGRGHKRMTGLEFGEWITAV